MKSFVYLKMNTFLAGTAKIKMVNPINFNSACVNKKSIHTLLTSCLKVTIKYI